MAKMTKIELNKIIDEALVKANEASKRKYQEIGGDQFPCGFAWVVIKPGNSQLANLLKERGLGSKHYPSGLCVWDPGNTNVQNVDIKYAGARAFADHLKAATGMEKIYAESRWD